MQEYASQLNPRTLSRRLIAIKYWHTYQGFPDPTNHPLVTKTMTGITRIHGKPKKKAAPLSPDDLLKIAQALAQETSLANIRDNAILQIDFFGALRRSEIIHICYEHLHWKKEGIEILLPSSKTDPLHEGHYCAIPYGNASIQTIMHAGRWKQVNTVMEYIEANERFSESAANHILQKYIPLVFML